MTGVEIRKSGSYLPLAPDGSLVNDCDLRNIPAPLADEVVRLYREWFGETLNSVYIRGSVARGNVVEGVSDLDTFAVLAAGSASQCPLPGESDIERLRAVAPNLSGFEFHACTESDVIGNYYSTWPFLVKTQSVCIHGVDYATRLKPYWPDAHIMGEAMYLPARLKMYEERLLLETGSDEKRRTCEWMMKALVRAAFDVTLDRLRRYTRDLYLCYSAFSEFYPEREADCRRALLWAIAPDDDTAAHRALTDDFGRWIVVEMQKSVVRNKIDLSLYSL